MSIFNPPIDVKQKKERIKKLELEIEEDKKEVESIEEELRKDFVNFRDSLKAYAEKLMGKWYEEQKWPDALLRRKKTGRHKCFVYCPLFDIIKTDNAPCDNIRNQEDPIIMLEDNEMLETTEKSLAKDNPIIKIDDEFKDHGRPINLSKTVVLIYAYFYSIDEKEDTALEKTKSVLEKQFKITHSTAELSIMDFLYEDYHKPDP